MSRELAAGCRKRVSKSSRAAPMSRNCNRQRCSSSDRRFSAGDQLRARVSVRADDNLSKTA